MAVYINVYSSTYNYFIIVHITASCNMHSCMHGSSCIYMHLTLVFTHAHLQGLPAAKAQIGVIRLALVQNLARAILDN